MELRGRRGAGEEARTKLEDVSGGKAVIAQDSQPSPGQPASKAKQASETAHAENCVLAPPGLRGHRNHINQAMATRVTVPRAASHFKRRSAMSRCGMNTPGLPKSPLALIAGPGNIAPPIHECIKPEVDMITTGR